MRMCVQVEQRHIDSVLARVAIRRPGDEQARDILTLAIADALGLGATHVLVHRGPLITPAARDVTRDPEKNAFMTALNATVRGATGGPDTPLHLLTPAGRHWSTYDQVVRPFRFEIELPDPRERPV